MADNELIDLTDIKMNGRDDFRETGYPISDEMWKLLISGKPLKDPEVLFKKGDILHKINTGINVIRGDGRILGYDAEENRFYDTKQYFGKEERGLTNHFDKVVLQLVAGIFLFGLVSLAARYILWKNNLPTVTPGTMHMLPLPDQLEYLQKEAARMDSINAEEVKNK